MEAISARGVSEAVCVSVRKKAQETREERIDDFSVFTRNHIEKV
jgi:hypothetical protein